MQRLTLLAVLITYFYQPIDKYGPHQVRDVGLFAHVAGICAVLGLKKDIIWRDLLCSLTTGVKSLWVSIWKRKCFIPILKGATHRTRLWTNLATKWALVCVCPF